MVMGVCYPVIAILMPIGFCVGSVIEMFRYMQGHKDTCPNTQCTPTNPCNECQNAKVFTVLTGCIAIILLSLAVYGLVQLILIFGVIPMSLIALVFSGITWFILKESSGKT